MEKILNVSYRSQVDNDALQAKGDCGAACVAMILDGFDKHITVDQAFKDAGGKHEYYYLSRSELITAAGKHRVMMERANDGSFEKIKTYVDANKPLIALVNYEAWSKAGSGVDTQDDFDNAHFVVVVGYDDQGNVFINDPLWWGSRRLEGQNKKMTYAQFESAWGPSRQIPSNPYRAGVLSSNPLPVPLEPTPPPEPAPPSPEAVSQEEMNLIYAWAAYKGLTIEIDITQRVYADVYLFHIRQEKWGENVIPHVIKKPDLGLIALRYYDDPLKWIVISHFNNLPKVNALKVGDVLQIPEPKPLTVLNWFRSLGL